jgi:spore coat polysaccharide biosynthesis predicted glycosyltransferase SpsG
MSKQGQLYFPHTQVKAKKNRLKDEITVVVFDVPYLLTEKIINEQKEKGRKIICLDCVSPTPVDLSLFIFKHPEQNLSGIHFIGYKYVIIRDEFLHLSSKPLVNNQDVLVALGGGDVKQQSYLVTHKLLQLGFNVNLVLGPLAKFNDDIEHKNLRVYHSPSNFPQLMNEASWCVVNAGGCLFEALFLKKPCLVLPQTIAEQTIAQDLIDKHQLMQIGLDNLAAFSLKQLQLCQQNINLIDAQGLARISQHISIVLNELNDEK